MTHRYGCDLPAPDLTVHRLTDGRRVGIVRCPSCGAVSLHREDTR